MHEFVLRGRRVVTPDGVRTAAVHVRDGIVVSLGPDPPGGRAIDVVDAHDCVVMPGIVDTHVHVNEPGRTDWEGFDTATKAAAAGGVTTIVDMPLNAVPATVDVPSLQAKRDAAMGQCSVDVGFWGGVIPGNASALGGLLDAGVRGFKCFLTPSGVPEFDHVAEDDLRTALPALASRNAVLLVHAEDPSELQPVGAGASVRQHATWAATRPARAEIAAIERLVRLAREYGARIHIVHLAAGEAIEAIERARREGLRITVETCPHYLTFCAEQIADGATVFKCAPPIRSADNRERLWRALFDGIIDLIASDHSPAPPELKCVESGDFIGAWGGIASLQLSLPAVWTAARVRGCTLDQLAAWMCAAPARLAGLFPRKGAIAPGADADFVIWDPDATFIVDGQALEHRHALTPYAGRTLTGRVLETWVRGERVFDRGTFPPSRRGRLIQ